IEADAQRLPRQVVERVRVVYQEDHRPIRVNYPAEPRPERRTGRDRDRIGDVCPSMRRGRPGIDHQRPRAERGVEIIAGEWRGMLSAPAQPMVTSLAET